MKWLFKVICSPLLRVNNNVYTFLSGIAISLSTNVFTTVCMDGIQYCKQWNLYLASILFAVVSALLILIAAKISGVQEFVNTSGKKYDSSLRKKIIEDATIAEYIKWVFRFLFLFSFSVVGTILLAIKVS